MVLGATWRGWLAAVAVRLVAARFCTYECVLAGARHLAVEIPIPSIAVTGWNGLFSFIGSRCSRCRRRYRNRSCELCLSLLPSWPVGLVIADRLIWEQLAGWLGKVVMGKERE